MTRISSLMIFIQSMLAGMFSVFGVGASARAPLPEQPLQEGVRRDWKQFSGDILPAVRACDPKLNPLKTHEDIRVASQR